MVGICQFRKYYVVGCLESHEAGIRLVTRGRNDHESSKSLNSVYSFDLRILLQTLVLDNIQKSNYPQNLIPRSRAKPKASETVRGQRHSAETAVDIFSRSNDCSCHVRVPTGHN
jgi:hypothetical protein